MDLKEKTGEVVTKVKQNRKWQVAAAVAVVALLALVAFCSSPAKRSGGPGLPVAEAFDSLVMIIFLLVVVPLLDASAKLGKYISLRYTLVAVCLIMALGCVLDFSHLIESSRNIVLGGGFILVGLFVVVRSLEKVKLGARSFEVTAKKGDIELNAKVRNDKESEND